MRTEVTEMERSSTLARKTQHKVKNGLRLAVTYLFLGLLGLVMVYPLLWMVASSFKENKGIFNSISTVSYAHLDVYKIQQLAGPCRCAAV